MLFNSRTWIQTCLRVTGGACLCGVLTGCPSSSNPTVPETTSTAGLPAPPPVPSMPGAEAPDGTAPAPLPPDSTSPSGTTSAGTDAGGTADLPEMPGGAGTGDGPLSPAEEVAVLDAELERGAGDFDAMILDTQDAQRERQREAGETAQNNRSGESTGGSAAGSSTMPGSPAPRDYEPIARAETRSGGRDAPSAGNAAIYEPPADIPDGGNDDVVARQLRELAMSEPDPAVRERLWEEYRKYKGIQ